MRTTRKVQWLVLSNFVLLVTKFLFLEENWTLGYNCTIFRFSQVFLIYNIQYNNNNNNNNINNNNNNNILRDSYCMPCLLLIMDFHFTCG